MFDTFREPNFFTFSVIFSHIASIFTFSVEFFSHLATFSHIAAFSHLRVPQGHSQYIYWCVCAAAHKKGVLGTGTTPKTGVLGTGTTPKRGSVLGTDKTREKARS